MKFLVKFTLVLATVSAFGLSNAKVKQRNIVKFAVESEGRITNGHNADVGQFPYQVDMSLTGMATLYFGATKRTSPEKIVTVDSSAFITHESWNFQTVSHDITLIRIEDLTYNSRIQPKLLLPLVGGNVAENLQYTYMRIIPNSKCAQIFGAIITSSIICSSAKGAVSTCQGDSGGPLVLESNIQGVALYGSQLPSPVLPVTYRGSAARLA
ncbi:hypothetical protein DOY81_008014 [Sarcophaga bullata]|nr:hypothetical protein DOY81_008014 [Sarcophaga bullata]